MDSRYPDIVRVSANKLITYGEELLRSECDPRAVVAFVRNAYVFTETLELLRRGDAPSMEDVVYARAREPSHCDLKE